jgi:hypothetical protein
MARVFLSHATKDRPFVEREVIHLLHRHGVDTWYCKDRIETAAEWQASILDGLRACDWFLVAVSADSVASKWVRAEVLWAFERRHGKIIPLLLGDCDVWDLHMQLPLVQHLDFRSDLSAAQQKLLAKFGVAPLPPTPPAHDLPPQQQKTERPAKTDPDFSGVEAERQWQALEQRMAENLERWKASAHPKQWVQHYRLAWSDRDWRQLLQSLRTSAFWPMKETDIGRVLDEERRKIEAETFPPPEERKAGDMVTLRIPITPPERWPGQVIALRWQPVQPFQVMTLRWQPVQPRPVMTLRWKPVPPRRAPKS